MEQKKIEGYVDGEGEGPELRPYKEGKRLTITVLNMLISNRINA